MRTMLRLLGPALLAVLLWRLPKSEDVLTTMASASPLPIIAAVALNFVAIQIKVQRWRLLLRAREIHYPMRQAWPAFVSSLYLAMLTPGRIGDALRARYLRHDLGTPYAEGLASVVVDRIFDLYVLLGFVAFGVARFSAVLSGDLAIVTWGGFLAILVAPLFLLLPGTGDRLMRAVFTRIGSRVGSDAVDNFTESARTQFFRALPKAGALTLAGFSVNYLQGWLIASAMHLDISVADIVALMAMAALLGLLPISVSGVGVRELLFALVFPLLGIAAAVGVSFGLVLFASIYLSLALIGFVSWQVAPPPTETSAK